MDVQIDNDGELVFADGDLVLLDDRDAIEQNLRIALRMFKGEWFLNPDEGMPYFQSFFTKNPSIHALTTIMRKAILRVPGVTAIKTLELTANAAARSLTVTFDAVDPSGQILTFSDFVVG